MKHYTRQIVEEIRGRWMDVEPVVRDFESWLFPMFGEFCEEEASDWKNSRDVGIQIQFRIEHRSQALIPRPLLRKFVWTCLDNLITRAQCNSAEMMVSTSGGDVRIAVHDIGAAYVPSTDIAKKDLGLLQSDVKHFGSSIELPTVGATDKTFMLVAKTK